MSFVDAHLHLADPGYAGKVEEVVENATRHQVACMLSNSTDYESSLYTINLAKRYAGRVLAAVGVHPFTTTITGSLHLEKFGDLVKENAEWIRAIGEIGLDGKYTRDEELKLRQMEVFRFFLTLAQERKMPVVIHSRQAVAETLEVLRDFQSTRVLLHWYDGPIDNLHLFKERGYLISIGPALLYSRRIGDIARAADPSIVLSETDGPVRYHGLFEGQLTQPSFVVEVVRKLAELKATNSEALQNMIFSNFQRFVGNADEK